MIDKPAWWTRGAILSSSLRCQYFCICVSGILSAASSIASAPPVAAADAAAAAVVALTSVSPFFAFDFCDLGVWFWFWFRIASVRGLSGMFCVGASSGAGE